MNYIFESCRITCGGQRLCRAAAPWFTEINDSVMISTFRALSV